MRALILTIRAAGVRVSLAFTRARTIRVPLRGTLIIGGTAPSLIAPRGLRPLRGKRFTPGVALYFNPAGLITHSVRSLPLGVENRAVAFQVRGAAPYRP